jgi:hypothetical protein
MPVNAEGTSAQQTQSATPLSGLSRLFGNGAVPAAPAAPTTPPKPVLKPIKTPHLEPISHPELAFSPSDIGVWEINRGERVSRGNINTLSCVHRQRLAGPGSYSCCLVLSQPNLPEDVVPLLVKD